MNTVEGRREGRLFGLWIKSCCDLNKNGG